MQFEILRNPGDYMAYRYIYSGFRKTIIVASEKQTRSFTSEKQTRYSIVEKQTSIHCGFRKTNQVYTFTSAIRNIQV